MAIIDISNDPNAHSTITPIAAVPRATSTLVPTPVPTPTMTTSTDEGVVGTIVASSAEPLVEGGRLGLIGTGLSALGLLIVQQVRQRRR